MAKYIVDPVKVKVNESDNGSVYESIVAMGMRARQINDDIRYEMRLRFPDNKDSESSNIASEDRLSVSKEFEAMAKPTFLAMKEIWDEDLEFYYPDK